EAGLLHVEDLASDRQDRLGLRIAALNSAAASGVTLNDEDLRDLSIAGGAVPELAGHSPSLKEALAASGFPSLARSHACGRCLDRFTDDVPGLVRVGFQPVPELVVKDLLGERAGLSVTE